MKKKVAIVGASGYSGEELVRLLLQHPHVELTAVTSRHYAGQTVAQVFPKFAHQPGAKTLRFTEPDAELLAKQAEIIFLALPHGIAAQYAEPLLGHGAKVIDLSADFRLRDPNVYTEFYSIDHHAPELVGEAVYGLPEIYREKIRGAKLVACPGCYPTSILLPLLPLIRERIVEPQSIIATSLSGVTGAGRKVEADYLFAECNESLRPYGVPKHRHLSEIEQELSIVAGEKITVQFTPHLVPVNRGILSTMYVRGRRGRAAQDLHAILAKAYAKEPFVHVLPFGQVPHTRHVRGSNMTFIGLADDRIPGRAIIVSALDNLTKGASGQAVQNMNVMLGYPETMGLTQVALFP